MEHFTLWVASLFLFINSVVSVQVEYDRRARLLTRGRWKARAVYRRKKKVHGGTALVFSVSVSVRRADNLENTWTLVITAKIQVTETLNATKPPKMLGIGGVYVITERKSEYICNHITETS